MVRIPWAGSGCGACGWKTRLIPADIGLGLQGSIFAMQIALHLVDTNIFKKITLDYLVANVVPNEENQPTGNQLILL